MYNSKSNFEFNAEEMLKRYTDFIRGKENKKTDISPVQNYEDDYIRVYSGTAGDDDRWLPPPKSINVKETKKEVLTQKEIKIEESDMDYVKSLQSHTVSKIQTIIEKVVDQNDYDEGPLYRYEVSQEVLNQMTKKAFEDCLKEMPELICENDDKHYGKSTVAEELVKQLLLIEVFGRRRPLFRSMRDYDYRYY